MFRGVFRGIRFGVDGIYFGEPRRMVKRRYDPALYPIIRMKEEPTVQNVSKATQTDPDEPAPSSSGGGSGGGGGGSGGEVSRKDKTVMIDP